MTSRSPFLVYYGHDKSLIPALSQAEVLIFERRGWTEEEVRELRSQGAKLIGYISAFAWPDWLGSVKWWWGAKKRDPQWNAWWMSVASVGWRYQINRMWRELRGDLDGLFFDNLDRLQQDPKSLRPFISILKSIRKEWPEAHLVGNRGFDHWKALEGHLDGILFENMTDKAFSRSDRSWVEKQLSNLSKTQVYALDYQTRCFEPEVERLRSLYPKIAYYRAPSEDLQTLA